MNPLLDSVEVRVLGSIVEKEITTPEYYPLTLNALVNACNQKSNRDPMVSYDEDTVAEALATLRAERFDCMVLDLKLPDISGFQILKRLEQDPSLRDLPAIVYTGRDLTRQEEFRERFRREARTGAALSHQGVATLYDVGEDVDGTEAVFVVKTADREKNRNDSNLWRWRFSAGEAPRALTSGTGSNGRRSTSQRSGWRCIMGSSVDPASDSCWRSLGRRRKEGPQGILTRRVGSGGDHRKDRTDLDAERFDAARKALAYVRVLATAMEHDRVLDRVDTITALLPAG